MFEKFVDDMFENLLDDMLVKLAQADLSDEETLGMLAGLLAAQELHRPGAADELIATAKATE